MELIWLDQIIVDADWCYEEYMQYFESYRSDQNYAYAFEILYKHGHGKKYLKKKIDELHKKLEDKINFNGKRIKELQLCNKKISLMLEKTGTLKFDEIKWPEETSAKSDIIKHLLMIDHHRMHNNIFVFSNITDEMKKEYIKQFINPHALSDFYGTIIQKLDSITPDNLHYLSIVRSLKKLYRLMHYIKKNKLIFEDEYIKKLIELYDNW